MLQLKKYQQRSIDILENYLNESFRLKEKEKEGHNLAFYKMTNAPYNKQEDRKSTRLNSSHSQQSRMPSSA